jgi:hypothetical protein
MNKLPPTLNDQISAARTNKYASAALKSQWHAIIRPFAYALPIWEGQLYLECVWYIKNASRDPDNIPAALKYILDTLVETKRIKDDNLRIIQSPMIHHYVIAKFDGFTLYLRDKEAFNQRLKEDLSLPPIISGNT